MWHAAACVGSHVCLAVARCECTVSCERRECRPSHRAGLPPRADGAPGGRLYVRCSVLSCCEPACFRALACWLPAPRCWVLILILDCVGCASERHSHARGTFSCQDVHKYSTSIWRTGIRIHRSICRSGARWSAASRRPSCGERAVTAREAGPRMRERTRPASWAKRRNAEQAQAGGRISQHPVTTRTHSLPAALAPLRSSSRPTLSPAVRDPVWGARARCYRAWWTTSYGELATSCGGPPAALGTRLGAPRACVSPSPRVDVLLVSTTIVDRVHYPDIWRVCGGPPGLDGSPDITPEQVRLPLFPAHGSEVGVLGSRTPERLVGYCTVLTSSAVHKRFAAMTAVHTAHNLSQRQEMVAEWFAELCRRTGVLVAQWQGVGFCHGVLNTDVSCV